MPEVVDWLADDGLDPAVFESGNHTAMWREIARFEAVLLERLQDWAARNVPADHAAAGVVRAGNRVSRAALKSADRTPVPAVQEKAVPEQAAAAPAERAAGAHADQRSGGARADRSPLRRCGAGASGKVGLRPVSRVLYGALARSLDSRREYESRRPRPGLWCASGGR